ncbi:unnamed protein product [Ascophyllum nodosum]
MGVSAETPKAVRSMLHSMLHAWRELIKREGRPSAAPAPDIFRELETPEQRYKIIIGVVFHGWKHCVRNPTMRTCRRPRRYDPTNQYWTKRMIPPCVPPRESAATNPEANTPNRIPNGPQGCRDGHPLGSRCMRGPTVPPDDVRSGKDSTTLGRAPAPAPTTLLFRRRPPGGDDSTLSFGRRSSSGQRHRLNDHHDGHAKCFNENNHHDDGPNIVRRRLSRRRGSKISSEQSVVIDSENTVRKERHQANLCFRELEGKGPWERRSASLTRDERRGFLMNGHEKTKSSVISTEVLQEVASILQRHARLEDRHTAAVASCTTHVGRASPSHHPPAPALGKIGGFAHPRRTSSPCQRCRPGQHRVHSFAGGDIAALPVGDSPSRVKAILATSGLSVTSEKSSRNEMWRR